MYGIKKSVTGKYSADEVDAVISKIKADYEEISEQQKNRIIELRNENSELKKNMADIEERKEMLATAMISAEKSAKEVIKQAEDKAKDILDSASKKEQDIDAKIKRQISMIFDLKFKCMNIMESIDKELEKYDAPGKVFTMDETVFVKPAISAIR